MQQMCTTDVQQSIKLLIIEYQKGHTSYKERAHFLVVKTGGEVPCLSASPFPLPLLINFGSIVKLVLAVLVFPLVFMLFFTNYAIFFCAFSFLALQI